MRNRKQTKREIKRRQKRVSRSNILKYATVKTFQRPEEFRVREEEKTPEERAAEGADSQRQQEASG
jgi:hypothetical protein